MAETPTLKPSYRRLLSNRSISLLWLGQLISQSGDFIFEVALLWYVLASTHSTFLVGITLAAELLPFTLISPIAGVYVDRVNRKTLMLVSNLFQAAVTFTLAFLYSTGNLALPLLLILVFLLSSGAMFFRPTIPATLPRMVTQTDLLAVNSLFTFSTSLNQLLGFGIGGLIVAAFGISLPILYDGVTFIIAAALFAFISRGFGEIQADSKTSSSFRANFREGLQYIRSKSILVQIVVVAVLVNFFGGAAQALLAPYAQDTLHGNGGTYGFILAAFSLGVILGSLGVGKINAREHVGKMAFLGVALIGVGVAPLGLVNVEGLAILFVFIAGLGSAIVNLPIGALLQVTVPSNLMGRVFTSLTALAALAQPLAAASAGGIATYTSVAGGLELFGALILVITAITALVFKDLRSAHY